MKNKTILITGGGSGIGEALVAKLSTDNQIIICGRTENKLKKAAAANKNVSYYVADISIPDKIDELFERITNDGIVLDVLVNNAGTVEIWDVTKTTLSSARIFESVNTNLTGGIAVTQKFISQANQSKENLIINITSEIAYFPVSVMPLYSASKTGFSVFSRALRILLKDTTFKVIEILPPAIDTAMSRGIGNTSKLPLPSDFATKVIEIINNNKTEYAPGSNVPMLKAFNKFLPKRGLKIIDKIIRKRLQLQ